MKIKSGAGRSERKATKGCSATQLYTKVCILLIYSQHGMVPTSRINITVSWVMHKNAPIINCCSPYTAFITALLLSLSFLLIFFLSSLLL